MSQEPFSVRHAYRPAAQPVPADQVPSSVRLDFAAAVREFAFRWEQLYGPGDFASDLYQRFKALIDKVLLKRPPREPQGGPWRYYLPAVIDQCEWWRFYDICEVVAELACSRYGDKVTKDLESTINDLFAREGLQWQMVDGLVVKRMPEPVAAAIAQATALLADPGFAGPDKQFAKALGHLSNRPEPDIENCIKDAVGAVEGTAAILAGSTKATLSDLLKREPYRSAVHPCLSGALQKVYAYRGDAEGVAHAMIGADEVGIEEAEWILTVSAATIVFLVSKFG